MPKPKSERWKKFEEERLADDPKEFARFTDEDEFILRNTWWDVMGLYEMQQQADEDIDEEGELIESAEKAGLG
eukprot:gene3239-4228_t